MKLILKLDNDKSISKEKWLKCVEFHTELVFTNPERKELDNYIFIKIENITFGSINYQNWDCTIGVDYEDRFFWKIYEVLVSVNKFLGTTIRKQNENLLSDKEIEKLLTLKHLKQVNCEKRYLEKSLNTHGWVAIKTDSLDSVLKTFEIDGISEFDWVEGVEKKDLEGGFVITPIISGWVLIAGFHLSRLMFGNKKRSSKTLKGSIEEYILRLNELSLDFGEIHSYLFYDRASYVNSFYKSIGGKLVYGEFDSEEGSFEFGEMPEEIKYLTSYDANDIAYIWSIDPEYLVFEKELEHSKIYYFRNEEKEKQWMNEMFFRK